MTCRKACRGGPRASGLGPRRRSCRWQQHLCLARRLSGTSLPTNIQRAPTFARPPFKCAPSLKAVGVGLIVKLFVSSLGLPQKTLFSSKNVFHNVFLKLGSYWKIKLHQLFRAAAVRRCARRPHTDILRASRRFVRRASRLGHQSFSVFVTHLETFFYKTFQTANYLVAGIIRSARTAGFQVSLARAFRRVPVSFKYLPWLQAGQARSEPL